MSFICPDPESVTASIAARATATNPQGAMKLSELEEIRSMHVTVANHAIAEVREAISKYDRAIFVSTSSSTEQRFPTSSECLMVKRPSQ